VLLYLPQSIKFERIKNMTYNIMYGELKIFISDMREKKDVAILYIIVLIFIEYDKKKLFACFRMHLSL